MISILQNDTIGHANSLIQDLETVVEQFNNWKNIFVPPTIIDKDSLSSGVVKLTPGASDNGIYFNAKWNGVDLRTFFDTGIGNCYIDNKATAEKIGVKLITTDTIKFNDNTKILRGVIDCLTIGKYSVKNVLVYVEIENTDGANSYQTLCDSIVNSRFDITLGMSIIKKLGVIEFDFEKNTMLFPEGKKFPNQRNIYISDRTIISDDGNTTWKDNLYLNLKIGNDNFLTFFDTGGQEGLSINTNFFEAHNQHISVESKATLHDGFFVGYKEESRNARYVYKCPQIEIQVQDKNITMINDCTVAIDEENDNKLGTAEGGYLGNEIFKYCKKGILDFNNMEFSIE